MTRFALAGWWSCAASSDGRLIMRFSANAPSPTRLRPRNVRRQMSRVVEFKSFISSILVSRDHFVQIQHHARDSGHRRQFDGADTGRHRLLADMNELRSSGRIGPETSESPFMEL